VGAICVITNDPEENPWFDLVANYLTKFGIAIGFQGVYLSNILFPIVFASSSFGVCAVFGSFASFLSIDIIYDFETNFPWFVFIGLSVLGICFALLLREK
jgi:hypothetical protein